VLAEECFGSDENVETDSRRVLDDEHGRKRFVVRRAASLFKPGGKPGSSELQPPAKDDPTRRRSFIGRFFPTSNRAMSMDLSYAERSTFQDIIPQPPKQASSRRRSLKIQRSSLRKIFSASRNSCEIDSREELQTPGLQLYSNPIAESKRAVNNTKPEFISRESVATASTSWGGTDSPPSSSISLSDSSLMHINSDKYENILTKMDESQIQEQYAKIMRFSSLCRSPCDEFRDSPRTEIVKAKQASGDLETVARPWIARERQPLEVCPGVKTLVMKFETAEVRQQMLVQEGMKSTNSMT